MDKPECNPVPPDVNQSEELLKKLLAIELERLDTAVRIERERKIVFPETTVIIHDILKLQEALAREIMAASPRTRAKTPGNARYAAIKTEAKN
jgi:hypothetical protein